MPHSDRSKELGIKQVLVGSSSDTGKRLGKQVQPTTTREPSPSPPLLPVTTNHTEPKPLENGVLGLKRADLCAILQLLHALTALLDLVEADVLSLAREVIVLGKKEHAVTFLRIRTGINSVTNLDSFQCFKHRDNQQVLRGTTR